VLTKIKSEKFKQKYIKVQCSKKKIDN